MSGQNQTRTKRIPVSSGPDVVIDNNDSTVIGLLGTPFAGPIVPGGVVQFDLSGERVNMVSPSDLISQIPLPNWAYTILNKLVTDQQGRIVLDRQGNVVYIQ